MKTNPLPLFLRVTLCGFALAGCASEPLRFGSAANVPVPQGESRPIFASACGFQLLLVIPIQTTNRYQRAYSLLAAQAGDAYITNVKVKESWTWGFVGTSYCTELSADAIRQPFAGSAHSVQVAPSSEPASALSTAQVSAPVIASGPFVRTTTNLRGQPKRQTQSVKALPAGTVISIVTTVANGEGEWHYVDADGSMGWLQAGEVEQLR